MTTDWRALCAELADALDHNRQCLLDDRSLTHPLADKARAALAQPEPEVVGPTREEAVNTYSEVMAAHECQTLGEMAEHFARAVMARWGRAGLADGPAVPEGREPASVVGEPSDEELRAVWCEGWNTSEEWGALNFARAVLARWGHHSPDATKMVGPAAGYGVDDVRYVVKELRDQADGLSPSIELFGLIHRAADLLEQLNSGWVVPTVEQLAPVPVSERLLVASQVYFEFVVSDADCCTQMRGIAPTYAQALSEGQQYLAWYQKVEPHTLELHRVEVLNLDALPLPKEVEK